MRKVFVALLFTLSLTAYPTTYYIDPSGQDASTRNGSKGSPWKTLAYACNKVKTSGDIIHVNSGSYNESVQSVLSAGVSIEGDGSASNIISGIARLNTFTILASSSSEATDGKQHISNIKMDGNSLTAYGAIRIAYRKNVEINNCIFVNFNHYGVSFINGEPPSVYATGNKFHDNTVTNCSGYFSGNLGSLEIQGQDGMLIYNNNMSLHRSDGLNGDIIYGVEGYLKNVKIYNNVLNKTFIPGITAWDFAIEFWNCLGGVEIYNNNITGSIDLANCSRASSVYSISIHNNTIGQSSLFASESMRGILLEANESDILIERNIIRNVAAGVFLDQIGSGRTVSNIYINANIFSNIGVSDSGGNSKGWGVLWTAESYKNHTVNNITICNNVLIGHSGLRSTMWGINLPHIGTAKNITIRNNIIRDFSYAPIYAYTQTGSETIDLLSVENNIFYQCGNNNLPRYSGIIPTNNTTRNNISTNPLFISSSDFHLLSGSPAIGKGLKIAGITTDIDGNAYNDPPSIGAYEFIMPVLPVYQSSLVSNASPSIVEITYNFTLAGITPAASAFTVLVNSESRSINSVSLSGTKIRLTLVSPVVAGDAISLTYNKPSVNFIQTPSGGQAVNIANKPVINNVLSVVPVYTGSVIENLTPELLEITYNLTLANVIPVSSAFTILVNSVPAGINSISISGTKVQLLLTEAVKFGDIVTISYTRPLSNPVQGVTGSNVESISNKPVTINIADPARPNVAPVIIISSDPETYSGFVNPIDASGTYDINNDLLSYEWSFPDNISVSSRAEDKIRFLAPIVNVSDTLQFQLKVSDGLTSVSKRVSIIILPYKKEIPVAKISYVEASDYDAPDFPQNIVDGDFTTNWAVEGDNQWILLKLPEPSKISHIVISFLKGQQYSSTFDIYASLDNVIWEPVQIEALSCDFSGDAQVFDFPPALSDKEYSYIKFTGHGNALNDLNIISEFNVFGIASAPVKHQEDAVVIYPNPAADHFYISVNHEMIIPETVRIYDLSGKIVLENFCVSGLMRIQLPGSIKSGVYIVHLCTGSFTMYSQQIVIKR